MKFIASFLTAALFLSAEAAPADNHSLVKYKLQVKSKHKAVDGKYVLPYHEGAGINYSFLSDQPQVFKYNPKSHVLYQSIVTSDSEHVPYDFSVEDHHILFSIIGKQPVQIVDKKLSYNGTSKAFAACKFTGDIYSYSNNTYELMNYVGEKIPKNCVPVTVDVKKA